MNKLSYNLLGLVSVMLLSVSISYAASAEQPSRTVALSPAKIELEAVPGTPIKKSVTVSNQLGVRASFEISFEDIAESEDESSVRLLGLGDGPFSLKNYISVPERVFTLDTGDE